LVYRQFDYSRRRGVQAGAGMQGVLSLIRPQNVHRGDSGPPWAHPQSSKVEAWIWRGRNFASLNRTFGHNGESDQISNIYPLALNINNFSNLSEKIQ